MAGAADLYERDFVLWSAEQAEALRSAAAAGANLPVDWANVAEEVEGLGKSLRRELASRTRTVIEHLLKLECSPAAAPRNAWRETILRSREEIADLLDESPSLHGMLPEIVGREQVKAGKFASYSLDAEGEPAAAARARITAGTYTQWQIFSDWLPDRVATDEPA